MKKYYNEDVGRDFQNSIDELKKIVRSKDFDLDDSNYGIAGNTFRAFRGFEKPSITYRHWAKEVTKDILGTDFFLKDQEDFDKWHKELFIDLRKFWKTEQNNKEPSFAHTYKMIDLYIKWLCSNKECSAKLANSLIKYAHCALDSQILTKLNAALNHALPIRKPSMGDIANQYSYDYCQSLIKGFSEAYNGTRLLFDYYAWKRGSLSTG